MTTRPLLLADELDRTDDAGKKRSTFIQRFASDLSVLLECPTDLIFVHRRNDLLDKKILTSERRKGVMTQDEQKYANVLKNFQRPGDLYIRMGWPIEEIVKLAHKEDFEALVLGTRSLQGLERFFLGSVAEEVVRSVKRPIFILGPGPQENDYHLSEKKNLHLIVATDLTKKCRAVETYAASFAKRTGARITFYYSLAESLHTAQTYAYAAGEVLSTFDTIFEDIKQDSVKSLEKKVALLKNKGIESTYHIENEIMNFSEGVLKIQSGHGDMVFMGHQSHGFIASTVLGSNLRDMIGKAKVPVVVVRS